MTHRPPRRNRAHLDDLMAGRPITSDPLTDVVAALRAPAQAHELAGLDAALAAFVAAPAVAVPPEEKTPMFKSVAGKLLALKIMALTAGAAAAGGVAYAAASGHLDSPNGNVAAVAGETSGAPASSGAPATSGAESSDEGSGAPGSSDASSPSESGTSQEPSESGAPSPSLHGLCTAWLAHPRDIAKVSGNPAFSVLISAAGGADSVNGYCTALLATVHPSHPAHPTQAQNPSHPAHPTQAQNPSHPAHPTQAQNTKPHPNKSSHPGGKPSASS